MPTVRSRAIELTADADGFEQPVQKFDDPGRTKLEADAYLAISVDEIVHQLVASDEHRERFLAMFSEHMTGNFGASAANTKISPLVAISLFCDDFETTYSDPAIVKQVLDDTPKGQRTKEACSVYVDACNDYYAGRVRTTRPDQLGTPESYANPNMQIATGLFTYHNEMRRVLFFALLPSTSLSLEERAGYLQDADTGMRKIASLTLGQSHGGHVREAPTRTKKGIDTTPDITALRALPKYPSEEQRIIRPHHMCVALPELPANEVLHGGSPIRKLWSKTAELVLATNLHALDDDREEYRIISPVAEPEDVSHELFHPSTS